MLSFAKSYVPLINGFRVTLIWILGQRKRGGYVCAILQVFLFLGGGISAHKQFLDLQSRLCFYMLQRGDDLHLLCCKVEISYGPHCGSIEHRHRLSSRPSKQAGKENAVCVFFLSPASLINIRLFPKKLTSHYDLRLECNLKEVFDKFSSNHFMKFKVSFLSVALHTFEVTVVTLL